MKKPAPKPKPGSTGGSKPVHVKHHPHAKQLHKGKPGKPGHAKKPARKPLVLPGGRVARAKHHQKRTLARPGVVAAGWILGGNDVLDNCCAVAVANSLLLATGYRAPDGEVLELFGMTGEASIAGTLAAVRVLGLGGYRPAAARTAGRVRDGALVGLRAADGLHAAVSLGGELITWGSLLPWEDDWIAEEAWHVAWT